jgi:GT2 family glycosyltransferase
MLALSLNKFCSFCFMEEPLVCVIVVTYNGRHLLTRMLGSLKKTQYKNFNILLVDNGSSDGSSELVRKGFPEVKLLQLTPNKGFSGANNAGTSYVMENYKPEYVVWLNDDMELVDATWLQVLVETAQRTKAGITGCKLLFPDGRIQYAGGFYHPLNITTHRGLFAPDNGQYDDEQEVGYVNGACFMINRTVIEKIGLLDEHYSPIYFEEADYCERARKAGFKVIYTGKTKIIHYTSITAKKEDSEKRYYIWEKNRIRFVLSHFPAHWWPFSFMKISMGVLLTKEGQNKTMLAPDPVKRAGILLSAFQEARKR